MRKKTLKSIFLLGLLIPALTTLPSAAQDFCNPSTTVFQNKEVIKYNVFYNLKNIWVSAGAATFTTQSTTYEGKQAWHITGIGSTYKNYDWIFKVRDKYETYINKETKLPMRFIRNVSEGGTNFTNDVRFNHNGGFALSKGKRISINACAQDVLSTIYFARNIDYDRLSSNTKIPFYLFLDDEQNQLYIRYLGKTTISTQYGTFRVLKIAPLLVKGTIFTGGEKMTVYVSDDANHIPVRIESPILVGSIKVDLMAYQNLKFRLSSKIK